MRIIAGQFRGRTLSAPAGLRLRPTSDALRETLFNILGPAVAGSVFVDACAGTGAVGIEALSRGAAEVVFVEAAGTALAALRGNLRRLGLPARHVLAGRVPAAFGAIPRAADFLFLDPPYAAEALYTRALEAIGNGDAALTAGGQVIVEHARRHDLAAAYGRLRRKRAVMQGDSQLSFFDLGDGPRSWGHVACDCQEGAEK